MRSAVNLPGKNPPGESIVLGMTQTEPNTKKKWAGILLLLLIFGLGVLTLTRLEAPLPPNGVTRNGAAGSPVPNNTSAVTPEKPGAAGQKKIALPPNPGPESSPAKESVTEENNGAGESGPNPSVAAKKKSSVKAPPSPETVDKTPEKSSMNSGSSAQAKKKGQPAPPQETGSSPQAKAAAKKKVTPPEPETVEAEEEEENERAPTWEEFLKEQYEQHEVDNQ